MPEAISQHSSTAFNEDIYALPLRHLGHEMNVIDLPNPDIRVKMPIGGSRLKTAAELIFDTELLRLCMPLTTMRDAPGQPSIAVMTGCEEDLLCPLDKINRERLGSPRNPEPSLYFRGVFPINRHCVMGGRGTLLVSFSIFPVLRDTGIN